MQHAFLYVSLPSLHDYEVKLPDFTFYGESKQATTKFSFSLWTWILFLGIQLQESSTACDKVNWNNRDKYWKSPSRLFSNEVFVEKYRGRWNLRTEFARFKWILNPVFHMIATVFSDLNDSSSDKRSQHLSINFNSYKFSPDHVSIMLWELTLMNIRNLGVKRI